MKMTRPASLVSLMPGALRLTALTFALALIACGGYASAAEKNAEKSTAKVVAKANAAAVNAEAAAETRLLDSVKYLASDELEGRGIGSKGIDSAADYIAAEFAKAGLATAVFGSSPFQEFTITTDAELGPKQENTLALVGPAEEKEGKPARLPLKLGVDFTPMALGGSNTFDCPLVFAGFGITAEQHKYDDFAGIDVKDKAVIILRKEPQQNNPHSVFDGTSPSRHALFSRKVSNAYEHGAAVVILVNDHPELASKREADAKRWQESVDKLAEVAAEFKKIEKPTDEQVKEHRQHVQKLAKLISSRSDDIEKGPDQLLPFNGGGQGDHRKLPVLFCTRASIDKLLKQAGKPDLATLESEIDKELKPRSFEIAGWNAVGQSEVIVKEAQVKNVIGVLEGEGPLAEETIVIGAHYDHLGRGGSGSLAPWTNDIHNGADDNASGTAALLEVARRLGSREKKLPRRVVFIAFTAEERGLIGSARYVKEPRFPLEKTVAMLNMDMVGRLTDDKLIVYGTGTADTFDKLIEEFNKNYAFKLTKKPEGVGPSDHTTFYLQKIPVMHFFTGTHKDYHRPSDDFDKINAPGMRRVASLVADLATTIAEASAPPVYQKTKEPEVARRGGSRPYFGSIPDFAGTEEGYALMGVTENSPAAKGGLKAGDVIIMLGKSRIGGLDDFDSALRKYKAGDKVPVTVKRDGKEVTLQVILDPPR